MWPFPKRVPQPEPGRLAIGNFTLTCELPNKRGMQIAGYMYSDDTSEEVNERLDLFQRSIERQRLRCEIPELEATLDQRMKGLDQAREVLNDLVDRQKRGEKLTSQEQLNVRNLSTNIGKAKEDIEKGIAEIADRKAKTGVA